MTNHTGLSRVQVLCVLEAPSRRGIVKQLAERFIVPESLIRHVRGKCRWMLRPLKEGRAPVTGTTIPSFTVGELDAEHDVGKDACSECWPSYPRACQKEGCCGLVHASFGDEDSDGDYWVHTKCDVCGETE